MPHPDQNITIKILNISPWNERRFMQVIMTSSSVMKLILLISILSGFRDILQAHLYPLRFLSQAVFSIKYAKFFVSFKDIKSDAVLEFAKADGTKVKRSGVAFLQMIGAVHNAIEEDTVL